MLEEAGFDRLSIEGIAHRAGVAKTTIYRWWSNKGVLAIEAFLTAVSPKLAFPETASPVADLRAQMHRVARMYRGKTGRLIRELVALSQADPETCRAFVEGYTKPRYREGAACLQRGIDRGELRQDLDIAIALDAIYGPIWHRLLLQHGPIDAAYVDRHLDMVLQGLAKPKPRPAPARRR